MSEANMQAAVSTTGKTQKQRGLWSDAFHDLRKRPTVIVSSVVILLIMLIGIFQGQDVNYCDLGLTRGPMSGSHWFGFDEFGCDYYAQAIYGAGPSIQLAI